LFDCPPNTPHWRACQNCVTCDIISSLNHTTTADACADELLETVPLLMRVIRTHVHARTGAELSMSQFRALAFLGRNSCAMLSDLARFLDLTHPAASKLVDGLLAAGLVSRREHARDRRRVSLELTVGGHRRYGAVLRSARKFLAGEMQHLGAKDRAAVFSAMQTLHRVFADAPDEECRPLPNS
jgi:DNA-binding MarR family transcriptional regulator